MNPNDHHRAAMERGLARLNPPAELKQDAFYALSLAYSSGIASMSEQMAAEITRRIRERDAADELLAEVENFIRVVSESAHASSPRVERYERYLESAIARFENGR